MAQAHKNANPAMERYRRENLLDDLFNDYDDYNKGSVAEIIAAICADLGVTPDLTLWSEPPDQDGKPGPAEAKVQPVELAQDYLKSVTQTAASPTATPPPRKRGRGPPSG